MGSPHLCPVGLANPILDEMFHLCVPDCPLDFVQVGNLCLRKSYTRNIEVIRQRCEDWYSKLWEPKSAEENSAPDLGQDYYLGVVYLKNETRWIYLSDGSNVTYFNWASGQPYLYNDPMTCVVRYRGTGLWYTRSCTSYYGFFCQHPLGKLSGIGAFFPPKF